MLVFEMDLNIDKISAFECPDVYDPHSFLEQLSMEGATKRRGSLDETITERIKTELAIIHEKELDSLFLVLWDCVRYAKSVGIHVGPGRGALPSSMVSYCLGITEVDPFQYSLLFERFLTRSLNYYPEIWMDFEPSRQNEVYKYAVTRFGTSIPGLKIEVSHDEGCFGDLKEVDYIGRTLTQIQNRIGQVIDINAIEFDDNTIFESIENGYGDDFSLLSYFGDMHYWQSVRPNSIEDVIAGLALSPECDGLWSRRILYDTYVAAKNTDSGISFYHECIKAIVKDTYGQLIYQEQIIQIFEEVAGFSPDQANEARRALCRHSEIDKYKDLFIYGSAEKGIHGCLAKELTEADGERLYSLMVDRACYTMNKSHVAANAILLYQVTWLKFYYPTDYMNTITTLVDNDYADDSRQMED